VTALQMPRPKAATASHAAGRDGCRAEDVLEHPRRAELCESERKRAGEPKGAQRTPQARPRPA